MLIELSARSHWSGVEKPWPRQACVSREKRRAFVVPAAAGSHRTCISSPSSSKAGFEGGGGRASRVTWPGGEAPDHSERPAAFLARTRATTFRSTSRSSIVRAAQPLSSTFTRPASNQVSSPSYLYCTSKAAAGAANSDSV